LAPGRGWVIHDLGQKGGFAWAVNWEKKNEEGLVNSSQGTEDTVYDLRKVKLKTRKKEKHKRGSNMPGGIITFDGNKTCKAKKKQKELEDLLKEGLQKAGLKAE